MLVYLLQMDIQSHSRHIADRLASYYTDRREAIGLSHRLLEEVTGRGYPEMILSDYKLTKKEIETLTDYTDRLIEHEPLQYILGRADFGELTLATAPGVLIPRPETALLCDLIDQRGWLVGDERVADLGTGTGAIALLLAHRHPEIRVTAIDVSPDAVRLARQNAETLGLSDRVAVLRADLLLDTFTLPHPVDLVVSNPPYILERERQEMAPHVTEREPAEALFVPDDEPALFYEAILSRCPAPRYALEINPLAAERLEELFHRREYEVTFGYGYRRERRFLFAEKG